ncbi:hypothetical protein [Flavobacterium sp.]|uniref:hypothetical protein n=1 Tax=Flavobacterium sp. TaxID=239 RepID=UPI0028BDD9C7|nr:hypothetical protein [Flavobacterium sp.]
MNKYNSIIANIVAFGPVIAFNIYFFSTKTPGSGIDFSAVIYSGIIAMISFALAKSIREKGKAK